MILRRHLEQIQAEIVAAVPGAARQIIPTAAPPRSTRCCRSRARAGHRAFLRDDANSGSTTVPTSPAWTGWPTRPAKRSRSRKSSRAWSRRSKRSGRPPSPAISRSSTTSTRWRESTGPVILRMRTEDRGDKSPPALADAGLARGRVPGARDLRPLRHRLRRPS